MRGVCACATVVCLTASVSAQPSEAPGPEGNETLDEGYYYTEYERSWYGWQTLAADATTLSFFFFTLREGKRVPAYTSLALFGLGTPAIHGAHRHWKVAAISGLSRFTLSAVGAVGVQGVVKSVDEDASVEAQVAAAVALTDLVAVAFDAGLLAYDEKETRVQIDEREGGWWAPQVGWTGRGAWLGLGGQF